MSDFALEATPHSTKDEAVEAFSGTANRVMEGDAWMGIMFEAPPNQLIVHRTSHQFPKHLIAGAIEKLKQLLQEEMDSLVREPLPIAERFRMHVPSEQRPPVDPAIDEQGGE